MKSLKIKKYIGIDALRIMMATHYADQEVIMSISKEDRELLEADIDKYPGVFDWHPNGDYIKGPKNSKIYLI